MMSEHCHIITPSTEHLPVEKAVASLKTALKLYDDKLSSTHQKNHLVTFSQPLLPLDLPVWLCAQTIYPRVFWMNREKDYSVAGIGTADRITYDERGRNDEMFLHFEHSMAEKAPHARYFGGFHFNNTELQDPIWKEFSTFSFVLPLVQLTFEHNTYSLSCNLWLEQGDDLTTKISAITGVLDQMANATGCSRSKLPELLNITYNPDETRWIESCEKALKTFKSGEMEKIMLARQTRLEFSSEHSPLLFLLRYPYPENAIYRFYFEPSENQAFFSFSPERLYRRNGNKLFTEALAGTCSKEMINGDDHHASEALLNSEKDIREHNFVREMIYDDLFPICSEIDMEEEVCVLQLNRLAHLYTRCSATLKPEFETDSDVLKRLHPTPAVGGVPKEPALQHIMELEPFSRGWYAAPVGWISRDAAEFSVAIRSALVNGRLTWLYSGAGLVTGSDPISEWNEVDQKIGDMLTITRQKV